MTHTIEVKHIDNETINVGGKEYYTTEYVTEMMSREYSRGVREGRHIHIAKIESCSNCTQH